MASEARASVSRAPDGLERVITTAQLNRRIPRPARPAAESRGLGRLSQALSEHPELILQTLCEVALDVCDADTAGISILDKDDAGPIFRWRAIAGGFASHLGGMTRREFGPCGTTLDRGTSQLFERPGRFFTYFQAVQPEIVEALLVPFSIHDVPVGTLWLVAHDERRKFDREDARVLTSMASFAGAGYSLLLSLQHRIGRTATPFSAAVQQTGRDQQLSDRENEIMSMMVRGVPQKEIAFKLGLSVKTVATHRQRTLRKLKLNGSFELLRYALDRGLVTWSEVH